MTESTILGPDGKPFRKPAAKLLTAPQAFASLNGVRQPWAAASIAAGLTPQRLAQLLANAAQGGDPHDYLVLAEEMEEREPHYGSVLATRKLAVLGLDRVVAPAGEDAAAAEIAEAVRRDIVEDEAFEELLSGCLDALGKGFSAVEIAWETGAVFKPRAYEARDPRHFVYDRETGRILRLRDEADAAFGVELQPFKFVVHEPRLKTGLPIRGGLARLAAWIFLFKSYSLKDWAAFCETYGQPLRVGKYGPAATEKDIEVLHRAVAMIGADCAATIPEAMTIEFVDSKAAASSDLYQRFCEFLDKQTSKAVLGQSGTTDMQSGGGYAQSKTLDGVREDLRDADARQLARTVRRDVIEPYVRFNYGPAAPVPLFRLQSPEAVDLQAFSAALAPLLGQGLKVRASEVLEKFGLSAPEKEDDVLGRGPAPATPPPAVADPEPLQPAANRAGCGCPSCGTRRARNAAEDGADSVDDLVDGLLGGDAWSAVDPLVEPLLRLAERAGSYEAFQEELTTAAAEMDAGAMARLLGPALFKARGLGDASDRA